MVSLCAFINSFKRDCYYQIAGLHIDARVLKPSTIRTVALKKSLIKSWLWSIISLSALIKVARLILLCHFRKVNDVISFKKCKQKKFSLCDFIYGYVGRYVVISSSTSSFRSLHSAGHFVSLSFVPVLIWVWTI